jgi:hypothetical protein
MNKKISLLLLLALASSTYAQDNTESRKLQFGVRTGLTTNSLQTIVARDDGKNIATSEGIGWQVGGSAYFNILEATGCYSKDKLGVEANLLVSDRMYGIGNNSYSLYYLELPVMATYTIPLTKKLNWRFQLGPSFGLGLAGENAAFTENLRRFNFGLTGGLNLAIGRFFIGTYYNFGMFNIAKHAPKDVRQVLRSTDLVIGWNF